MKNTKSIVKYTVYGLLSALLLATPFLLLPLPIFKADDLNPLLLLFVIAPLVLLLQGLSSELMLRGKVKLAYIITAPFIGIFLMVAFYFAVDTDTPITFSETFSLIGELFTYPMTILSIIYVIAPWMGAISVKIFKKLRKIFKMV